MPTRKEARPRLLKGARAACHQLLTRELSGTPSPPDGSGGRASSPQVKIELFAIGGACQVARSLPPPEFETCATVTQPVASNGLNPIFDEKVHTASPNDPPDDRLMTA